MSRRYVIISPCRDEAKFMRRTLDTVLRQSVLPARWVIVDDGSSDDTRSILAEYADQHDFIRVIRRQDQGRRRVGAGVVEAFCAGCETVNVRDYDYVCKLDLDLEVPPRYFEILIERMEATPRIGTCSGKPYFCTADGTLVSEACGDETSVGASKFYRVACFLDIGGFVPQVMWDGIDCHRCRMKGWIARSWDEPELRFVHLRPMGSSQDGIWTGRMRHGSGQYFMGVSLTYMTASALYRMTRRPFVVGGVGMWWGYVSSMVAGRPRYGDLDFRQFLRDYQWDCLRRGKKKATQRIDDRQLEIWIRREREIKTELPAPA